MLAPPGDEKNQRHAATNCGVGDVERGKTDFVAAALLQVEAKEIHHFVPDQTVGQVSGDAAKNQSKSDLAGEGIGTEMMPREKQRDQGQQRDQHKGIIIAAENVPGRAGVSPMDEFEEAINDDFFLVGWQRPQHQPFGELVEGEDDQCDNGNAAVRRLENGSGSGHSSLKSKVQSAKSSGHDFELWILTSFDYVRSMALARILVDGYSLLHNWPELAPGRPRHSARAREELIHVLTRYHDATGEPIAVFFDGAGARAGTPAGESNAAVEVLFSRAGQTADQMIERAAHRF